MDNINLNKYVTTNPFYLSTAVYVVMLFIILYSFDTCDMHLNQHVKFFIYCFSFLIFYNMFMIDTFTKKIKEEYRIGVNNTSFKDVIDN